MEYIKSNLFGIKSKLFSFLNDLFFKALDRLFDPSDISDIQEEQSLKYGKGGSFELNSENNESVNVSIFPEDSQDKNVVIVKVNDSEKEFKDVDSKDIIPTIQKYVKETTGQMLNTKSDTVQSSITAKFSKVCSDDEATIQLTRICCDTDPHTALMLVDSALSDDEFIDQLSDGDTTVEFTNADDEWSVDVVQDECCESNPFEYILLYGYKYWNVLRCIHWNAKGDKFELLHRYTDNDFDIHTQIDMLSEWSVQYYQEVHDMAYFMKQIDPMYVTSGFNYEDGIRIIQAAQRELIEAMLLRYEECSIEVQSILDNWIYQLSKEANYILTRPQL